MESTATTTNKKEKTNTKPMPYTQVDISTAKRGVIPTEFDAWDEVNMLRRALKENSRGYLASTAAVVISCCFLVSIAAGSLLAMPVVMVVATYDSLQRFFKNRKAAKESTADLRVVPSSEGE